MSEGDFTNDQEVVEGRRSEPLGSPEATELPEEPLKERIPKKLKSRLEELEIGDKVIEQWSQGNAARSEQLERQRKLLRVLDEFMEPIYQKPQEWMSNIHIPVAFMICKVFHARMLQAVLSGDPPFQVTAEKSANLDRASLVQDLMSYTTKRWANKYEGIDDEIDKFLWMWCTSGRGILKLRWDKEYTRFVDVEETREQVPGPLDEDGNPTVDSTVVEKPVKKDELVFEGPVVENVPNEDVLILGGDGNPDKADFVAQQVYHTAHEMWSFADRNIFDKDAVEKVIQSGRDIESAEEVNSIKQDRAENAGENSPDEQNVIDRYQIIEAYIKVDLDGSGIESDVVAWVHKDTKEIVRATYLYRLNKTGRLPFAVSDFHKRSGDQSSAVGLVELIFTLQEEMDAMHNMKIDFGVLSTLPIGFYRASSALSKERIPLSPGKLIPLEDPSRDIAFPNLGNRSAFVEQEEAALFQYVSRITGLSDLNFGSLQSQGAARTATGARAVVNESNANLDVFLQRANRGIKKALTYLFQMLKQRMPEGLEFRITGDDGNDYFKRIESREELAGLYDFEVEPNSANSNQQIRISQAQQAFQLTQNPLMLQLGIVTPNNVYEAAKNLLEAQGMKGLSRFLTKPQGQDRIFTPEELANRVLAGVDVQLDPQQDLEGFVAFANEFLEDSSDEALGQLDEGQVVALQAKVQEARQLMQAIQAAQRQAANAQQVQQNAEVATQQQAPNEFIASPGGGGES